MLKLGNRTYGTIECRGNGCDVIVGKYCSLAKGIIADCGWSHNTRFVSTYPFGVPIANLPSAPNLPNMPSHTYIKGDINIGNDVYIGEDVVIMSGVRIFSGAVIGARSIITKDVAPYTIVVGNDRFIRQRFTDEQIEKLKTIKWWDYSDKEVDNFAHLLMQTDINLFLAHFE